MTPALNLHPKILLQETTPMADQISPKPQEDGKRRPRRITILHPQQAFPNTHHPPLRAESRTAIRWVTNTTRHRRRIPAVAAAPHLLSRNNTLCSPPHRKQTATDIRIPIRSRTCVRRPRVRVSQAMDGKDLIIPMAMLSHLRIRREVGRIGLARRVD
jgi:hypothetical protein